MVVNDIMHPNRIMGAGNFIFATPAARPKSNSHNLSKIGCMSLDSTTSVMRQIRGAAPERSGVLGVIAPLLHIGTNGGPSAQCAGPDGQLM